MPDAQKKKSAIIEQFMLDVANSKPLTPHQEILEALHEIAAALDCVAEAITELKK